MEKRVLLITGTPCVGKTTLAKRLAEELAAQYINLTEFAEEQNLIKGQDTARDTLIIDETKMRRRLNITIQNAHADVIIDGHYAPAVVAKCLVSYVFVLRRDPVQLREFMKKCGFSQRKQDENLTAEILDVCLVDALHTQAKDRVCELNVTTKTLDDTAREVLEIIEGRRACYSGCVDWLGALESQGILDEFLRP